MGFSSYLLVLQYCTFLSTMQTKSDTPKSRSSVRLNNKAGFHRSKSSVENAAHIPVHEKDEHKSGKLTWMPFLQRIKQ